MSAIPMTHQEISPAKPGRARIWAGRVLSGIAVAFLLFDGTYKLTASPIVAESTARLGYPPGSMYALGIIQLVCLAIYLVPRTAVLGAILWTGYLGGAIATHYRVSDPLFSHTLFPTYVAALLWVGLWLRNDQLRRVVPFGR